MIKNVLVLFYPLIKILSIFNATAYTRVAGKMLGRDWMAGTMLKASALLLVLVVVAAAADLEDNATETATTITVLALNHRPSPFFSSEINALALQASEEPDSTQQVNYQWDDVDNFYLKI